MGIAFENVLYMEWKAEVETTVFYLIVPTGFTFNRKGTHKDHLDIVKAYSDWFTTKSLVASVKTFSSTSK